MWSALIIGYVHHGLIYDALNCFRDIQVQGLLYTDVVIFLCLVKTCGTIGSLSLGEDVHMQINQQHLLEKDVVLATALVDMYVKCGAFSKAREVFNELSVQGCILECVEGWICSVRSG